VGRQQLQPQPQQLLPLEHLQALYLELVLWQQLQRRQQLVVLQLLE
jgi:hypothetical protein